MARYAFQHKNELTNMHFGVTIEFDVFFGACIEYFVLMEEGDIISQKS